MAKHHPDENMLTEYAAGSLEWALSLSVAAHLHFCVTCRNSVWSLNHLGGTLLSNCDRAPIDTATFEKLMARIHSPQLQSESLQAVSASSTPDTDNPAPAENIIVVSKHTALTNPPRVVRKLIPRKLKWKFVTPSMKMAPLVTGQEKFGVALHRISSGGRVGRHNHRGREVTLVLQGSFSDGFGVYSAGDFVVREPGQIHRPTATENEDCICLTVSEMPAAMTGLWGKVLSPFLSTRPQ